jgi:hypothetical protein
MVAHCQGSIEKKAMADKSAGEMVNRVIKAHGAMLNTTIYG